MEFYLATEKAYPGLSMQLGLTVSTAVSQTEIITCCLSPFI